MACVAMAGCAGEPRVDNRSPAATDRWDPVNASAAIDNRLAVCLLEARPGSRAARDAALGEEGSSEGQSDRPVVVAVAVVVEAKDAG